MPTAVLPASRPIGVWIFTVTVALVACVASLSGGREVRVLLQIVKLYFVTGARG